MNNPIYVSYLDQVRLACREVGVDFHWLLRDQGVPESTLWRWERGVSRMSEQMCQRLMIRLQQIEEGKRRQTTPNHNA